VFLLWKKAKEGFFFIYNSIRKNSLRSAQKTRRRRKMFDKFIEKMNQISMALNENVIISSVKDSFLFITPFIIMASIGTLGGSVICSSTNGLAQFESFAFLANLVPLFSSISYGCLTIISLMVAFNMGRFIGKQKGCDPFFTGLLGLVSYICVVPTTISITVGDEIGTAQGIASSISNANGLFLAMFIASLSTYIFAYLSKIESLKIKLPNSVPPMVSNSFSSLVPTILTVFIIALIGFIFQKATGMYLSDFIYTMIQVPLVAVVQNPAGPIVITLIGCLFWIFGIHGSSIVSGIMNPMMIAALQANMDAVAQGQEPVNIVTRSWNFIYTCIGGFGCTLGLVIAILIFSKRPEQRTIAKLALPSSLFEINEPVLFGLPVVMNPYYAIPFILAPVATTTIGYLATYFHLVSATIADVPWCMPPFINGYLATGGDIRTVICQALCLVVAIAIYAPFVIASNKQQVAAESEAE
jgi:PTS system cellobiose-specific IIC component